MESRGFEANIQTENPLTDKQAHVFLNKVKK